MEDARFGSEPSLAQFTPRSDLGRSGMGERSQDRQPQQQRPQQRHREEKDLYGPVQSLTKPLFVEVPDLYGTNEEPEDGPQVNVKVSRKVHYGGKTSLRITPANTMRTAINILFPPLVFLWTVSFETFYTHFRFPTITRILVVVAILPGISATLAARKARRLDMDPRWNIFAAILLLGAWVAGMIVGEYTFWYFMQPFYALRSMKVYNNISPSRTNGAELMDAGQIHFAEEESLQTDMSMSYTNYDVYCVAPIGKGGATAEDATLASYDFWAVGVNCCRSDNPGSFACGEYKNPQARAGLRQWSEEQRHFFRLAVEQAEAAFNIEAKHPVFVYWVQDPDQEVRMFFTKGYMTWLSSCCMHFFTNLFLVIAFVVMFRRDTDVGELESAPIVN